MLNFARKIAHRSVIAFITGMPEALCLSLEIFVRRRFGERYLTWSTIVMTFFRVSLALGLIAALYHIAKPDWPYYASQSGATESLWMLSFWLCCVWHKFVIWSRNQRGEQWYSYAPGDAFPLWRAIGISEIATFRFAEPMAAVLGALACAALRIDGSVSAWLLVSGLCLFVKRQLQYYTERRTVLDMIDSRTRSERLRSAMGRQSPHEQPDGYTVTPAMTYLTPELREELMRRYGTSAPPSQTNSNAT